MQVEITITINVPDGTEPIIKVDSKTTKLTPEIPKDSIREPKSSRPSPSRGLAKVATKPKSEKEVTHLGDKPKAKTSERKCLYCGKPFVAHTHNHKFDTKRCKDAYNRTKKPVAAATPKPATLAAPKKKVTLANPQKRMQVPQILVSKDSFYQEQLHKAHKQHGKAYSRYINEHDL